MHFGIICVTFRDLGLRSGRMGSRVGFLVNWEWKSCQDPMVGCAETRVNTMVFDRFHYFY